MKNNTKVLMVIFAIAFFFSSISVSYALETVRGYVAAAKASKDGGMVMTVINKSDKYKFTKITFSPEIWKNLKRKWNKSAARRKKMGDLPVWIDSKVDEDGAVMSMTPRTLGNEDNVILHLMNEGMSGKAAVGEYVKRAQKEAKK